MNLSDNESEYLSSIFRQQNFIGTTRGITSFAERKTLTGAKKSERHKKKKKKKTATKKKFFFFFGGRKVVGKHVCVACEYILYNSVGSGGTGNEPDRNFNPHTEAQSRTEASPTSPAWPLSIYIKRSIARFCDDSLGFMR